MHVSLSDIARCLPPIFKFASGSLVTTREFNCLAPWQRCLTSSWILLLLILKADLDAVPGNPTIGAAMPSGLQTGHSVPGQGQPQGKPDPRILAG